MVEIDKELGHAREGLHLQRVTGGKPMGCAAAVVTERLHHLRGDCAGARCCHKNEDGFH
jgi:hypothetical protein